MRPTLTSILILITSSSFGQINNPYPIKGKTLFAVNMAKKACNEIEFGSDLKFKLQTEDLGVISGKYEYADGLLTMSTAEDSLFQKAKFQKSQEADGKLAVVMDNLKDRGVVNIYGNQSFCNSAKMKLVKFEKAEVQQRTISSTSQMLEQGNASLTETDTSGNHLCGNHFGKNWEYEKCMVPKVRSNIKNGKSYWLIDFKNSDSFAIASQKLAQSISGLKEPASSPFCMATFLNSPRVGKDATMVCAAEFSNGYDKTCKTYSVNLGTMELRQGQALPNSKGYQSTKCDRDSILTIFKMGGATLLSGELYNGGVSGDMGVYVYRDDFDVVAAWLDYMGNVNEEPKGKEKKTK